MATRDLLHFLLFLLLTLLAEVLGTIGGFGSSVYFVPLFQWLFDFQTVLALTGLLHVFSNTAKLYLFWKTINWQLVLTMGVSSLLLAVTGAYLTTFVNVSILKLTLGTLLIAISMFFLLKKNFIVEPTATASVLGGSMAGFLAGFVGTGGAIRGLVLTAFQLEKNMFVGTSAAIDFAVDLSRTFVYLNHSFLSTDKYVYIPILIVCSFAGSYLGKLVVNRMSQDVFRKFLLIVILSMGLIQVYQWYVEVGARS